MAKEKCDELGYIHFRIYLNGFVPNSYKYRAPGSMIIGRKVGDTWITEIGVYDRKRSYGEGPHRTGGKSKGMYKSF